MNGDQFAKHLLDLQQEIEQYISSDAPVIAGKIAVDHFTENFQKEGFVDNGVQKWEDVKRRMNPKKQHTITKGKNKGTIISGSAYASRPILTGDTGDLGRSINYKDAGDGQVTIHSDLPYSEAHNEGTSSAGRNHSVTIPKRQFIGESAELDKKIMEELERKIGGILKK